MHAQMVRIMHAFLRILMTVLKLTIAFALCRHTVPIDWTEEWRTSPPPHARLYLDKSRHWRGCVLTDPEQLRTNASHVSIKFMRCGAVKSVPAASPRLRVYRTAIHSWLDKRIDDSEVVLTKKAQSSVAVSESVVPPAIRGLSHVCRDDHGTFSAYKLEPPITHTDMITGSISVFDCFFVTAYHVTEGNSYPGTSISADPELGRLAVMDRWQDTIICPSNTLQCPHLSPAVFNVRAPVEGEIVFVQTRSSSMTRPPSGDTARWIRYRVYWSLSDKQEGLDNYEWQYHPVDGTETVPGDSGSPVYAASDSALVGIHTGQTLFVAAVALHPAIGTMSWAEAHDTFADSPVSDQEAVVSTYARECMGRDTVPLQSCMTGTVLHRQRSQLAKLSAFDDHQSGIKERSTSPFAQWLSHHEFDESQAVTNRCVPATVEQIMDTMYVIDNEDTITVPEPPYAPRPAILPGFIGDVVNGFSTPNVKGEPRPDLIWADFSFTASLHGMYVKVLCMRYTGKMGHGVTLTGAQIWDAACLWIKIAAKDVAMLTGVEFPGGRRLSNSSMHRCRSLFFMVPEAAHRFGYICSLEEYWDSGGTAMITVVLGDTTPFIKFNHKAIDDLDAKYPTLDRQVIHWLKVGVNMDSRQPRHSVFCPNLKGFANNADSCAEKLAKERTFGHLSPCALGPRFAPQYSEPFGYVDKGAGRVVTDRGLAGGQDYAGLPLDQNSWELVLNSPVFTEVRLPTVINHGVALGIIYTLQDAMANVNDGHLSQDPTSFSLITGFSMGKGAYTVQAGGTDLSRMFKQFSVQQQDQWAQGAVVSPAGMHTSRAALFGDKNISAKMQRCGSWKLRTARAMSVQRILQWASWTPNGTRSIAGSWDFHPIVQAWRAHRWRAAQRQGLSGDEAIRATIPLDMRLYIDDDMLASADMFMSLVFAATQEVCEAVQLDMSLHKNQRTSGSRDIIRANADGVWLPPARGEYIGLGKEFNRARRCIRDTPKRVHQLRPIVEALCKQASRSTHRVVDTLLHQQALGIAEFVAQTEPAGGPLLQFMERAMHCQTRLSAGSSQGAYRGHMSPFPIATEQAWEVFMDVMDANRGVTFVWDTSYPTRDNTILVVSDAAGYSEQDPHSFRGGCSLVLDPNVRGTEWTVHQWSPTDVQRNSTQQESATTERVFHHKVTEWNKSKPRAGQTLNIVEVMDSFSSVLAARRQRAKDKVLKAIVLNRSRTLAHYGFNVRSWIIWCRRTLNTETDDGSKGKIHLADAALRKYGLPPRRQAAMDLPPPSFTPVL